MGNTNLNIRRRQRGANNENTAADELERLLVTEYDQVKAAYQTLPS